LLKLGFPLYEMNLAGSIALELILQPHVASDRACQILEIYLEHGGFDMDAPYRPYHRNRDHLKTFISKAKELLLRKSHMYDEKIQERQHKKMKFIVEQVKR
jgi:hypothetical protein